MRTKCLITGASGNLGSDLVRALRTDHDVLGLCRQRLSEGLRSVDIREPSAFLAIVEEFDPDVVIHSAAYRDPDFCEDHREETWRLNVEPLRLLCENLPAQKKLVLISSDYVYDGTKPPYHEEDPTSPVNVYGESKVAAERLLLDRPDSLIVRPPLLVKAGATVEDSGFIGQMLGTLLSKEPVGLDDVLMRFPIWTRDVAAAVVFLLERELSGIYHTGGPEGGTRYEWTIRMGRLLSKDTSHLHPSREIVQRRAARPGDSHLDTGKIEAAGFGPFTPFAEFVPAILKHFDITMLPEARQ